MQIVKSQSYRSEGLGVNHTDDKVRVTVDMSINEFKKFQSDIQPPRSPEEDRGAWQKPFVAKIIEETGIRYDHAMSIMAMTCTLREHAYIQGNVRGYNDRFEAGKKKQTYSLIRDRHYQGSTLSLKDKIEANIWDSIDAFIDTLNKMHKGEWVWYKNTRCKYINLRVDMRDGGCLIMDKDNKRIDPKDLEYQYKEEKNG